MPEVQEIIPLLVLVGAVSMTGARLGLICLPIYSGSQTRSKLEGLLLRIAASLASTGNGPLGYSAGPALSLER
jgi:hypothetical protein